MPEWIHVLIRSVCALIGLFFIIKILGKKQLSELSFFETIVGISIGDIAATISMDLNLSIAEGLTALIIWSIVPFFIDYLSLKSKKFRDYVQGKSTVFIKNGNILEGNLKKEKITADELMEMLRKKNVFKVADVEFATFEPTGELSVMLKKEHQPLRYEDVFESYTHESEPNVIIMDGEILVETLNSNGYDINWIQKKLGQLNLSPKDVYLGQVDANGQLHVDLYNDNLQPTTLQDPKLILSSMKRCLIDFEISCLQSTQSSSAIYKKHTTELELLIKKLENQLL